MSKKVFFTEFFKRGKMVGSIHPSSDYLSRKMVAPVDFENARVIIELGPGDGCITRAILHRIKPETHLILVEMNETFVKEFLNFDRPNTHVYCDSAEHIGRFLQEHGFEQADAIVSSLPLTNIPKEIREHIIDECVKYLKPGGVFTQYQYMTTAARMLRQRFTKVRIGFTPYNIPPAWIYTCTR